MHGFKLSYNMNLLRSWDHRHEWHDPSVWQL